MSQHKDKSYIVIEEGKLVSQNVSKITNKINNIGTWTDAFISNTQILGKCHPNRCVQMLSCMSVIREAVKNTSFEMVYDYDTYTYITST